jgi:hypothetical protein
MPVMCKMKAEWTCVLFELRANVHDLQSGLMQQRDERLVRSRSQAAMLDRAGPQGARRHDQHDRVTPPDEIVQARGRGLHLVVGSIGTGDCGQAGNQ